MASKRQVLFLPHANFAPLFVPGSAGERQEHLDSITAFLGTGQRRSLFRALDTFCGFLLNAQLMFLTREFEHTGKHLDDHLWIRFLMEDEVMFFISEAALTPEPRQGHAEADPSGSSKSLDAFWPCQTSTSVR